MEECLDLAGREFFHGAQRNSFQAEASDLVTTKSLHIVPQLGEEEPDFALFTVMHVHVQVGGVLPWTGMDEGCSLHFQTFAFDRDAFHQQRQAFGGKRFLKDDVVSFYHEIGGMHQPVREISVGGQNHQTLAVLVQAAGAEKTKARKFPRQNGKDRLWVVWIVV